MLFVGIFGGCSVVFLDVSVNGCSIISSITLAFLSIFILALSFLVLISSIFVFVFVSLLK
jgi:hypothetical protein